ncbi:hypothetical protein JG677_02745 [Campylobacter sp. TTU-622]|uniref:hypothetical protein n=1 Tax=Campylobacter TaxID=194 RepID=UPI0019063712|nr:MULTISPECIES: hypothetical protein [Campylobacter]MBK1964341.1 hypothetical protein [Campylobacter novaezeelandiae]MBK1972242.1 hypothetical protein [Campylobacter sp. TTU_617]MBK1972973.1 hypothetical protein [Campylobacter sp. TTU-622]MBK1992029.1 hypothetical protein [Campylobacter sp. 2018MI34]MBK1993315.1 hypothetical protein [Campylobacter novaezeelandiae]
MQTNFKIISSYEYDISSGVYKQVNKEVEDFSSSEQQSFMDMLSNESSQNQQNQQTSLETQNKIQENDSTMSSYALNSNLYSYRFRQNEESQIQSQSINQNEQNTQNKVLNELLGMI